ncbi:TPA: DUF551 domain-containing protein [Klebsiella pneumoniae]|nr:DUF551 domain-containing protein [Klebsiella pneumoniae]
MARMALAAMDSSESVELPLDYLQGHKDGLEWAARLAEANHPETGDWLYDDPIELAKAIRKGPDMPPAQPVADSEPVAVIDLANLDYLLSGADADVWPPEREEMGDVLLYRHAQPAPVVPDEIKHRIGGLDWGWEGEFNRGWNACRAAMLAAAPQSPGSEPATVPGKWISVSERMPENDGAYLCWDNRYVTTYAFIFGAWQANQFIAKNITHWMPLPAGPQEVR